MIVDRKALIDTMAQSIGQAIGGPGWWAVAKHEARDATRREAAAALAALETAGYAVVPRELSADAVDQVAGNDIPADTVRCVHERLVREAAEWW